VRVSNRLIKKLDLADQQLDHNLTNSQTYFSENLKSGHGMVEMPSQANKGNIEKRHLILTDVLHTINLMITKNENFETSIEDFKLQNFDSDFLETLKGTQLNTLKSLFNVINKDLKFEDQQVQTLSDPWLELSKSHCLKH